MKLQKTLTVLTAAALLGTIGCGKTITREVPQSEKIQVNINSNQDAATLADAAEQLVTPYTFMLADSVLDTALTKDPENKKAQLYKLFLKPMMLTRGLAKRSRPMISEFGNIKSFDEQVASFPESPLKKFYLDSTKEDIKTSADVQNLYVQQREALIEFHKFLKLNQNLSLDLNLNPYVFQEQIKKEAANSCTIKDNTVTCDFKNIAIKKINSADMVALSQSVAGYVALYTLYTTYTVDGLDTIIKASQNGNLTAPQIQVLLENQSGLGLLRKDNRLSLIQTLGADFVAAWKWAIQYQSSLCPVTAEGKKARPGFLFDSGVCVPKGDQNSIALGQLETVIGGGLFEVSRPVAGGTLTTQIKPMAIVTSPVQDLRTVAPAKYTKCADGSYAEKSLRDHTLGGLFPKADADEFVLRSCEQ